MKKNIRTIDLAIGTFVAGVVATLAILYIFVLPDMVLITLTTGLTMK